MADNNDNKIKPKQGRIPMNKTIIEMKAEDIFPFLSMDPFDFGYVSDTVGVEGRSKGVVPEVPDFYRDTSLNFSLGIENLERLVQEGKIEERDFKVRFDGCDAVSTKKIVPPVHVPIFRYGLTHFFECKEDMNKKEEDIAKLKALGKEYQEDQGYYLARGMGTVVLPMTSNRKIVVGVRRSSEYDGEIHGPAGWLTFSRKVEDISPRRDAYKELREELAVESSEVNDIYLLGTVAYPTTLEVDAIYFARLSKPSSYFESDAWKEAVDAKEHRELITLSSPEEMLRLVQEGKPPADSRKMKVVASSKYGLETLARCWKNI